MQGALKRACEKTGALVESFMVGPEYFEEEAGRHEWLIELKKMHPTAWRHSQTSWMQPWRCFLTTTSTKRKDDFGMKKLRVRPMHSGTFYKWMEKRKKLGGQNKVPHLRTERDFLEELLQVDRQLRRARKEAHETVPIFGEERY